MCKIMPIIGIGNIDKYSLDLFLRNAANVLTGRQDDDGFGYAGLNHHGVFGERWLDVDQAFRERYSSRDIERVLRELGGTVEYAAEYARFGRFSSKQMRESYSLLLHARLSTNSVSLANTHPFVIRDTALIHNGVVTAPSVKNEISTCDSELILQLYLNHGVDTDPSKLQLVFDGLSGYWACAVLAYDGTRWIVDVFKEKRADLYYAEIRELGARVYCTSREMLTAICRKSKFNTPKIFEVLGDTHVRYDAVTGEVLHTQILKPQPAPVRALNTGHEYSDWKFPLASDADLAAATAEARSGRLSDDELDDAYSESLVESLARDTSPNGYRSPSDNCDFKRDDKGRITGIQWKTQRGGK